MGCPSLDKQCFLLQREIQPVQIIGLKHVLIKKYTFTCNLKETAFNTCSSRWRLCSSVFWSEPYCAVPWTMPGPCQGGLLCECSSTLVESEPPWYPFATLCTRFFGATRCIPIGHGLGLRSGAHCGIAIRWFALARSGPLGRWSTSACFQTGSATGTFTAHYTGWPKNNGTACFR